MPALRQLATILIALLYVVSPVDAIPDLLPGIGWLDDLLVLVALTWYLMYGRRGQWPWDALRDRLGGARAPHSGPSREDFATDFSRMDPYALLEVTRDASPEEIRTAYRRAVARYHPDKVAHLGKEFQQLAHQKLLAIQQAYEILQSKRR
jgi:hypothetical protein